MNKQGNSNIRSIKKNRSYNTFTITQKKSRNIVLRVLQSNKVKTITIQTRESILM